MEIRIRDDKRIVEVWLTNAEKNNPSIHTSLKPLYQSCRNRKYTVAVFESGSRDLYADFHHLAQQHRHRMAMLEVQRDKRSREEEPFIQ